jgi:hypothetical protein
VIRQIILLLALLAAGVSIPARADDNRPLTVSITQEAAQAFRVSWKVPPNIDAALVPAVTTTGCTVDGGQRNWSDGLGNWREERWQCPEGLIGHPVTITWPRANPALATIVRYRAQGEADPRTLLLQPQETGFTLAASGEEQNSFLDFILLGFEHIWAGIDHLLFVAGLIFIARTPRRVLATITGFTIAHSITLALAALDVVHLPTRAIEGVIALSIVFLAVELAKGPRDTLTWRMPIVVASAFGLLHGFGFAVVLSEIGLPSQGLVAALLGFNLGIELGQIVFAALILVILRLVRKVDRRGAAQWPVQKLAGYAVGILASFWMFQRMLG